MLRERLQQEISAWEQLNHPALLQRFVTRNGKLYTPRKRIGRKARPNECFNNAANYVMRHGGTYVEGYVVNLTLPLPIHHAWVSIDGDDAMDPTLDSRKYEYFGVPFERKVLLDEMVRNGVYGLLDPGVGLNWRLMFEIDPALQPIIDEIAARRIQRESDRCSA